MTSSDWARLFRYLIESYLPTEHSSGRNPGENTQNQAWLQVISSVRADPQPEAERGVGNHILFPKGRGKQEFGRASGPELRKLGSRARIQPLQRTEVLSRETEADWSRKALAKVVR